MQIDEISDLERFLALEPEWNHLWARGAGGSFFLEHAWVRCCWRAAPPGTRPMVLIARDGAAVIGIAAFVMARAHWRVFPTTVVSLMHNQDSPCAGVLVEPQHAERVLSAMLGYWAQRSGWHLLSFAKIERASPLHAVLAHSLEGRAVVRLPVARSPVLVLDGDWQMFWTSRSQRFKKTVRSVVNRLERRGAVSIDDVAVHAGAAECARLFREVAARSWKADLPISVIRNPEVAQLFELLTETLHARSQLVLWVLRIDGSQVATEYHVRDGDRIVALRSDFDERYRDDSPGAYLNYHIIRAYFGQGVRVYDMGPGDSEYKLRWATGTQEYDSFWLFNRTPYAMTLYNLERRALPRLRRAREWFVEPPASAAGEGVDG